MPPGIPVPGEGMPPVGPPPDEPALPPPLEEPPPLLPPPEDPPELPPLPELPEEDPEELDDDPEEEGGGGTGDCMVGLAQAVRYSARILMSNNLMRMDLRILLRQG